MRALVHRRRAVALALLLALLASLSLASASGLAAVDQELLKNGSFENGFVFVGGCGMVGKEWGCFTNGGMVDYGFYDDQWEPVVAHGTHSQLIELSTLQYAASQPDRYAGIYQTVKLVKGATYQLKLSGLMRERNPDPAEDRYRYRVQWGYTADGSIDSTQVTNWVELPWDKIDERTAPSGLQSFSSKFKAPSTEITIFIRVWKKWGTAYKELDVNVDAISLFGPSWKKPRATDGRSGKPAPPPTELACGGANLIHNGSFENGFARSVGKGWKGFNNGGGASYGFYDEMWAPVIKDGAHGQLIEINTYGLAAADPDRFAGIYQVVKGLKKGATYEFSLWGMMREEASHADEDRYRYRVQWGYAPAGAHPSVAVITNWVELPWDQIYLRTAPGDMSSYSVQFMAPSDKVIVGIRTWKKWGTTGRELDVNLDAIRLAACSGKIPSVDPKPMPQPEACGKWIVVKRGDTVYGLARRHGSSLPFIVERNRLADPNVIIVGQKLCIKP